MSRLLALLAVFGLSAAMIGCGGGETPSNDDGDSVNIAPPADPDGEPEEGGETPAAEGGETPAAEGGETPAAEGGETPAAEGGETPAAEGGETPPAAKPGEESAAGDTPATPDLDITLDPTVDKK